MTQTNWKKLVEIKYLYSRKKNNSIYNSYVAKSRFWLYLLVVTSFLIIPSTSFSQTVVNYTYDGSNFCNPERGFYKYSDGSSSITAGTLSGYRAIGYTLLYRIYYINNSGSLSAAFLTQFDNDMLAIRNGGMKCILRFAYTSTDGNDAPVSTVLSHLDQLQPHFASNYDVIAILQMGFIGRWGEGYYTNNFGDVGVISTGNWNDRTSVLLKELNVMPVDRMVAIRYPWHKKTLLSRTTTITAAEAYTGTNWARVGFHDDAFMAASDDWGTFPGGAPDRAWLSAESTYLSTGGEAESGDQSLNGCTNTMAQMSSFHFSYVDRDYNTTTINKWSSEGCFATIEKKMGYRFYLNNGTYTTQVKPGNTFNVNINITNEGYAAPFNPRWVEVVLKNISDGKICKVRLNVEPRKWLPGSININEDIGIPSNYPAGTYKVYLNLPDPVVSLYGNPAYSIRMANTGTWDATTGYNDLGMNLVVNSSSGSTPYSGSQWFDLCYGTLPVELISFTGEVVFEKAKLNWSTITEKQNSFFEVQKSNDGTNFITIGKVNGANNSIILQDYHFIDQNPGSSIVYYRLKQVDNNGNSSVFNSIELNMNASDKDIRIYPNPSNEIINIDLSGSNNKDYDVEIYNSLNTLVFNKNHFKNEGINISCFPAGVYFVHVRSKEHVWNETFIKVQ